MALRNMQDFANTQCRGLFAAAVIGAFGCRSLCAGPPCVRDRQAGSATKGRRPEDCACILCFRITWRVNISAVIAARDPAEIALICSQTLMSEPRHVEDCISTADLSV